MWQVQEAKMEDQVDPPEAEEEEKETPRQP